MTSSSSYAALIIVDDWESAHLFDHTHRVPGNQNNTTFRSTRLLGARTSIAHFPDFPGHQRPADRRRQPGQHDYVANNPLLFVDPTGMEIEFAYDETKSRKEKRMERREFMKSRRELNRKSEAARSNWKALKRSDNVHTVHLNKKEKMGML